MTERTEMNPADFTKLLDVARGALNSLREKLDEDASDDGSGDSDPTSESIFGEGVAGDGHVRVIVDRSGRAQPVVLDRHARSVGSEELATQVVLAYNAAREDLRSKLEEQTRQGAAPDPYELNEKLLDAQADALRQSLAMIDSFSSSTRNLARAAGTDTETE